MKSRNHNYDDDILTVCQDNNGSFEHYYLHLTKKLADLASELNMIMFDNDDVSTLLDEELKDDSRYKSIFCMDSVRKFVKPISFIINTREYFITMLPTLTSDRMIKHSPHLLIFSIDVYEYRQLVTYLAEKYKAVEKKENILYTWNNMFQSYEKSDYSMEDKNIDDLVGLDEFFRTMENDITGMEEKTVIAKKLGACNGVNYLVYGRPGVGKTSAVKALAQKLSIPIYVCNLVGVHQNLITNMLNPTKVIDQNERRQNQYYSKENSDISARLSKKSESPEAKSKSTSLTPKIKLVLIEDFDRYINQKDDKKDTDYMSSLLNALSGTHDSFGTIRIFTANFPENALYDEALRSRITRFIKFETPSDQNIIKYIRSVFLPPTSDNSTMISRYNGIIETLGYLFKEADMTIRDVNRYLSLHIMNPDPLESGLSGFKEYAAKITELNNSVPKTETKSETKTETEAESKSEAESEK